MTDDRERKRRYHDVEPPQGTPFRSSPGVRGKGYQHGVEPLRHLETDVPLPYVIDRGQTNVVAVTLTVGQTVLIDSEGLVSNEHGTVLFRLLRVPS